MSTSARMYKCLNCGAISHTIGAKAKDFYLDGKRMGCGSCGSLNLVEVIEELPEDE